MGGSLIYFSPLLLYFPRLVPGVETQPLLAVMMVAWALLHSDDWRATARLAMLSCIVVLVMAVQVLAGASVASAASLGQLLIGPFFFFGLVAARAPAPGRGVLAIVTSVLFLLALVELWLPGAYESFAVFLLDRVHVADGIHGITLLTPEPTYASIALIYLLLLSWWTRGIAAELGRVSHAWIEMALLTLLVLTYSTYALLMLAVLAFVRWPKASLTALGAAAVIVPTFTFSALGNEDSIRAVVAISRFLSADFSSLLTSISLIDESLASRVTTNLASFQMVGASAAGLGLDCTAIPRAFESLGYDFVFTNQVLRGVLETGCLKPQSYLAALSLGLGAVALAFFGCLLLWVRASFQEGRRYAWWWPGMAMAGLLLAVQGQITHPAAWFLLYFSVAQPASAQVNAHLQLRRPTPLRPYSPGVA